MRNLNQKQVVLRHLGTGKTLTTRQARNNFRIGNVREVVRRLREEGHPIYTNHKNGRNYYRLGTARKSSVANTYRTFGGGAFVE